MLMLCQVSIPKPMAEAFKLKNNTEVLVTKVSRVLLDAILS